MTERIQNFRIYTPTTTTTSDDEPQTKQQNYLILIHGLNGNLQTWTPTLAPNLANASGMNVITFDQPCYGRNPLPFKHVDELVLEDVAQSKEDPTEQMLSQLENVMRPSNLAIELHKLLTHLDIINQEHSSSSSSATPKKTLREERKFYKDNKIKPFLHIFGQSFGGKTAVCFADRYPHLVASLSLGDIGIVPCNKYTIETARDLAVQSYIHHVEYWPDEESVKNYIHTVFGGPGGDDVGRKYIFDSENRNYVSLVRPHVGFIHDFLSRKCDLREAWSDFEGPVCVFRAGDAFTCLSDSEWKLMKNLRIESRSSNKSSGDDEDSEEVRDLDTFVTPSADGYHGVYRSHPELFESIFSEFLKKVVAFYQK